MVVVVLLSRRIRYRIKGQGVVIDDDGGQRWLVGVLMKDA